MLVGPSTYLKQIIQIEFNWIPTGRRQISLLSTSIAEDLNSGLPWTNPGSGQSGTCKSSVLTTRPCCLTFKTASTYRAIIKESGFSIIGLFAAACGDGLILSTMATSVPLSLKLSLWGGPVVLCHQQTSVVDTSWPLPKQLIITLFATYPHWSPPCNCVHPSHPSPLSTNAYSPPTPQ